MRPAPPLLPALALGVAALAGGCSTSQAPAPDDAPPAQADTTEAGYQARLEGIRETLEAAVGESRATSVEQCRVVPVGAKPCGGPWYYVAHSTSDGEPEEVAALAAEYTRVQEEMNQRFGLASTCEYVEPPQPALEGGRCVAR